MLSATQLNCLPIHSHTSLTHQTTQLSWSLPWLVCWEDTPNTLNILTLPYIFIHGYDFFCHPHAWLGHLWWIGYRPRLWGGEGWGSRCYCMPYLLFTPHPSTLFPERPSLVHFPFPGCFSCSSSKDIMVGGTVWWYSSSHPACNGLVLHLHMLPSPNVQTLGHYAFTSPITFQKSLMWVTRQNITLCLSQNLDSIWQSPHLSVYKRLKPKILHMLRSSCNASCKESMGLFFVGKWCGFRDFLGVPVFSAWWNFWGLTFFHAHRDYVAPQKEPIVKVDTNNVRLPSLTRNCSLPQRLQEKHKFCPHSQVGHPTSIPFTLMLSYYSSALYFVVPWATFLQYHPEQPFMDTEPTPLPGLPQAWKSATAWLLFLL